MAISLPRTISSNRSTNPGRSSLRRDERRDVDRVFRDEGRPGDLLLGHLLVDRDQQVPGGRRRRVLDPELRRRLPQEGLVGQALLGEAAVAGRGLRHRQALPGRGEVDRLSLVGELRRAEQLRRQGGEHLLGQRHHLPVGRVRLVELDHRELGVVLGVDPLVPEVPVDLEDALEPADEETLQVELRGDPQVQVHIEGVVVGHERARRRAPGHRLHHRRLDLEEVPRRQEGAEEGDDPRPPAEDLPDVLVDDQVHVPLPVPGLDVGEPVPLLRKGADRLRQQAEPRRLDGQLARAGEEQGPLDPDDVARVDGFQEEVVRLLPEVILFQVRLQPSRPVGQDEERRLPEAPETHHPPGDVHPDRPRGQFLRGPPARGAAGTRVGPPGGLVVRPRILPPGPQRADLEKALLHQVVPRLGHAASPVSPSAPPPSRYFRINSMISPSRTASTFPVSWPVRWSFTMRYGAST